MANKEVQELRVAANSNVKAVAGSISKCLEEGKIVEIYVIGAGALNQAVKGVAMARGFIATKGYDVIMRPGFASTEIEGNEKTSLKLVVSLS